MHEKLTALVRNSARFSDKAHQTQPSQFSAFGIGIGSRYGKCDEIVQMLQFARAAAGASVAHYVKEVDYDSKASICAIVLDDGRHGVGQLSANACYAGVFCRKIAGARFAGMAEYT